MKRLRLAVALIVCAALAYVAFRVFKHEQGLHPAIVTPRMDSQQAISPSIAGRMKRLMREQGLYGPRGGRPKLIALTFDDGPYPVFTPLLLDELNELKIPATFFLIGHDAQLWPDLTERIERSGGEIADHTQTHPDLDRLTEAHVQSEISTGGKTLYALSRDPSALRFFRPPHGRYTLATIRIAQRLAYTTILWNDDPGDWRASRVTPAELARHVREFATAPDIVLLHNGRLATIEMLPQVAAAFRRAGYHFVTVGELMKSVAPDEMNHPAKRAV